MIFNSRIYFRGNLVTFCQNDLAILFIIFHLGVKSWINLIRRFKKLVELNAKFIHSRKIKDSVISVLNQLKVISDFLLINWSCFKVVSWSEKHFKFNLDLEFVFLIYYWRIYEKWIWSVNQGWKKSSKFGNHITGYCSRPDPII